MQWEVFFIHLPSRLCYKQPWKKRDKGELLDPIQNSVCMGVEVSP